MTAAVIFARIKTALRLKTDKALAERLNVPLRRLQTWKSRNTLRFEEILLLCEEENIDLNLIFFGRNYNETHDQRLAAESRGAAEKCKTANYIFPPKKRLDIHNLDSDQIVDTLLLNAEWTQYVLGLEPKNLALIRVIGNNMSPWVTDGDLVIIDTCSTTIVTDAPYALLYDSVIVIKRLIRLPDGAIVAKSDSQYCEDERFADETTSPKIVGRVMRRLVR